MGGDADVTLTDDASPTPAASTGTQNVARIVVRLRDMVLNRELPPGAPIRQEETARRLGISRVPLREALRVLATEGLLTYRPHRGYVVAALTREELGQIYLLLEFLETEIVRSLTWPDEVALEQLRAINDRIRAAAAGHDNAAVNRINREFHMSLFRMSSQKVYLAEAERFWLMSDPYRLLHVATSDPEVALNQHEELIAALAARDRVLCLRILTQHRNETNLAAIHALTSSPQGDGRSAASDLDQ